MARHNVVWTRTAARQRRSILQYWLERNQSPNYPLRIIELTDIRIGHIAQNPESFPLTTFPEVRSCSLGHFSILYKIVQTDIVIVAFWDNRQDPRKLRDLLSE